MQIGDLYPQICEQVRWRPSIRVSLHILRETQWIQYSSVCGVLERALRLGLISPEDVP